LETKSQERNTLSLPSDMKFLWKASASRSFLFRLKATSSWVQKGPDLLLIARDSKERKILSY
jgi:hypothetical protein